MERFDVIVLGGGPAGATAALLLARAGRRVAIVEKAEFPRRKVCGEYLAAPAAAWLRALGARPGPEIRRIALWPGARTLQAPLPAPYARTLAREELDALLLERAGASGAVVYQPLKALALERAGEGWICHTRAQPLAAPAVVAAHGSWETGALPTQAQRTAPQATDLLAFKAHFRGARIAADTIALAPFRGGYGGLVALGDGRATFACCLRRGALETLRQPGARAGDSVLRHALSASAGLRAALGHAHRDGAWQSSGPLRPGMRAAGREGVFAVGNAAGEVHPLIGSGISMALGSAALLIPLLDAALGGRLTMAAAASAYEEAWRRQCASRLRWSACFARCAALPLSGLLRGAPWLLTLAARAARR